MKRLFTILACCALLTTAARAQVDETPLTEADLQQLTEPSSAPQEGPMSASELAALGLGAQMSSVDKRLQFSGFTDFTFGTILSEKTSGWRFINAAPNHPSFFIGNVNLYLSKFLTEKIFTLGEIRFTYLPNGSSAFGTEGRESTTAYDYADFGRAMRWGGIEIERFVLDWIALPQLTVRFGQFLTPYGIWNVDHGSPTVIPPRRPWCIGIGWIPERQTGIELFGSADVSTYGTLGYHLTLSNGTGPVSEYADLDNNKAFGGRLYYEYRQLGQLRIGGSFYYGRDTDSFYGAVFQSDGTVTAHETIRSQYDNLTFAGDAQWLYESLVVQTEWLVHQRAYTEAGRAISNIAFFKNTIPADVLGWGGYVLLGYRLPWLGIMPFFVFERDHGDATYVRTILWSYEAGLNVRPIESLVFKVSYHDVTPKYFIATHLRQMQAQIAWAF